MAMPVLGSPAIMGAPLREAGVLAMRRTKQGKLKFLLISKRRTRAWGIPKGRLSPVLTFRETAAQEAFEEAGVIGVVSPNAIGMFRAKKRAENPQVSTAIEVWVYLLEVSEQAAEWPEKGKRDIRWASAGEAARALREPVLAELCAQLARA